MGKARSLVSRSRLALRTPAAARSVGVAFGISGVAHFARPAIFRPLVPRWLPRPDAWIYVSGAAEVACAVGLATDQRWARPASVALLVAVLPGNITYAMKVSGKQGPASAASIVSWFRVPLQLPMIVAVWPERTAQSVASQ